MYRRSYVMSAWNYIWDEERDALIEVLDSMAPEDAIKAFNGVIDDVADDGSNHMHPMDDFDDIYYNDHVKYMPLPVAFDLYNSRRRFNPWDSYFTFGGNLFDRASYESASEAVKAIKDAIRSNDVKYDRRRLADLIGVE